MWKTRVLLRKIAEKAKIAEKPPPPSYMPSAAFMYAKVRRPGQKKHFVKVASELELLKDVYGAETLESLKINDEIWGVLMEMAWDERYIYLMEIMDFREKNREKNLENLAENRELISSQNLKLWSAGNMVYARHFHSLVDIYGPEFRQKIDNFHGRNLLKQGENLKHFIVDCRFLRDFSVKTQAFYTNQMQSLHDDNWTSSTPFELNFVNYQADQQLSSIAKKNLLFQYGPPSISNFKRHPFAPQITPRRVESVVPKDRLLYISPRATRFLPDTVPADLTGVVICLSQDASPATSSQTACIADRVQPYQIPFKRVIRSTSFRPERLQLWQLARIFRGYFAGNTIDDSIRMNLENMLKKSSKSEKGTTEMDEKNETFRSAMYQINNCLNPSDKEETFSMDKRKRRMSNQSSHPPSPLDSSSPSSSYPLRRRDQWK